MILVRSNYQTVYIIMKLDALPGAYLKKIRNISKSNLNKDDKKIKYVGECLCPYSS